VRPVFPWSMSDLKPGGMTTAAQRDFFEGCKEENLRGRGTAFFTGQKETPGHV